MSLADIVRPRGQHRLPNRLQQLEYRLAKEQAATAEFRRRLAEATAARDTANAKANRLEDALLAAAGVTRERDALAAEVIALRAQVANLAKVGTAHSTVAETQPIPVLPLHLSPLAGTSPAHVPGA